MSEKYGLRVGANVRWLYLKLAVETVTELVSVSILLSVLNVEGYGLFAAVSSSVGAFGFFMGALEGAARRFVCCDSRHFAPLLGLTLALALVVGALGGLVCWKTLPYAAAISLPVLGTVVVRLLRIPYETCFVTDERMGFFFFVALVEAALTISAAASAGHFSIETVAAYATLRLVASVAAGAMVVCRCLRRHPFSFVRPQFRLGDVKDLMRFFGWQALGSLAGLLKGNGIVILLVTYAGTVGCAACDSSGKFSVLFWGLIANYRTAYLPGIVKAWTDGDRVAFVAVTRRAFWRSVVGSVLVALPFFIFAPEICRVCQSASPPAHAEMFLRMFVVQFFFEALATPFDTAILAAGRIALYEIVLTVLIGSSFFLAWVFLASGMPTWTATGAVATVNTFAFGFRLFYRRFVLLPDGTRAWSSHGVS